MIEQIPSLSHILRNYLKDTLYLFKTPNSKIAISKSNFRIKSPFDDRSQNEKFIIGILKPVPELRQNLAACLFIKV
ncbi:hypothetical protein LEP1GSC076_0446 [Leptospira sp. Fiocruz LV4135]|nr:hypothetical protein LEP1GSC076_0446 [Leptospira sp. Fiocruz LV4135]